MSGRVTASDQTPTPTNEEVLPESSATSSNKSTYLTEDSGHGTASTEDPEQNSSPGGVSRSDQKVSESAHEKIVPLAMSTLTEDSSNGNLSELVPVPGDMAESQSQPLNHPISCTDDDADVEDNIWYNSDFIDPSLCSTEYLKTALENFNKLYEDKLKMVEDVGAQGDVDTRNLMLQKKASILESWAKDVCVQNIVLIHTVEELEKQGEERLQMLQNKLTEANVIASQHNEVVQAYERKVNSLLNENKITTEQNDNLRRNLETVKEEVTRIRKRLCVLEKDNDSLTTLITRIRDMGVWDVTGLELEKRTYDQIFGLYPNLPGSEVQTVFTKAKLQSMKENEETINKLEREMFALRAEHDVSLMTITKKDSAIMDLEKKMSSLSERLNETQKDCEHYKKQLIETQERLLEATQELQMRPKIRPPTPGAESRHAEIQELLNELRNVKVQLSSSLTESQEVKQVNIALRKEFTDRLQAMQNSQKSMQSDLSHTLENHHQLQEKEVELLKVREEAKLYRQMYEASQVELNIKDKRIEELENTVSGLNAKEKAAEIVEVDRKFPMVEPVLRCCRDRSHSVARSAVGKFPSKGVTSDFKASRGKFSEAKSPKVYTITSRIRTGCESEKRSEARHVVMKPDSDVSSEIQCNKRSSLSNCGYDNHESSVRQNDSISNSQRCDRSRSGPSNSSTRHSSSRSTSNLNQSDQSGTNYGDLLKMALESSKRLLELSQMNSRVSSVRISTGRTQRTKHVTNSLNTPNVPYQRAHQDARSVKSNTCRNSGKPENLKSKFRGDEIAELTKELHLCENLKETLSEFLEQKIQSKNNNTNIPDNTAITERPTSRPPRTPSFSIISSRTSRRSDQDVNKFVERKKAHIISKTEKIQQEIAEIKDEWNRIFSNIGGYQGAGDYGPDQEWDPQIMPPAPIIPIDHVGSIVATAGDKMNADETKSIIDLSKLEETFEFEMEKLKEDFQKQLHDKDVEITMQKPSCRAAEELSSMRQNIMELCQKLNDTQIKTAEIGEALRNTNVPTIPMNKGPGVKIQPINQSKKIVAQLLHHIVQLKKENTEISRMIAKTGNNNSGKIHDHNLKDLKNIIDCKTEECRVLSEKNQALAQQNLQLKEEMEKLKMKLNSTNEKLSESTLNSLMELDKMKSAFLENENKIKEQSILLEVRDKKIKKYDEFCTLAVTLLDDMKSFSQPHLQRKFNNYKEETEKYIKGLNFTIDTVRSENLKLKHILRQYMRQVDQIKELDESIIRDYESSNYSRGDGENVQFQSIASTTAVTDLHK